MSTQQLKRRGVHPVFTLAGSSTVILAAACGAASSSRPGSTPSSTSMTACFSSYATAPAPRYLGRTSNAAKELAASRSEHLIVVGADGRCLPQLQVLYTGPDLTVEVVLINDKVNEARSGRPPALPPTSLAP